MNTIELLKKRYATKRFDPLKDVEPSSLERVKESARLAATSYGLQLMKILEIPRGPLRKTLQSFSWNQAQVAEAHTLFVLCVPDHFAEEDIKKTVYAKAQFQNLSDEARDGYLQFIHNGLGKVGTDELVNWMGKQTYIALANMMLTCAEEGLDSCPMEGFEAEGYIKTLKLKSMGLKPVLLLPVGHRSAEDKNALAPKFRKNMEQVFETIKAD